MPFQGCSRQTERKEYELHCLSLMRMTQYKHEWFHNRFPIVWAADVFCGTGYNAICDKIVDGSPIQILDAYMKASTSGKTPLKSKFRFWFSDIQSGTCDILRNNTNRYGVKKIIKPMPAKDALNKLGNRLAHNPNIFLYLVIDPNGPKDFPKNELIDLLNLYSNRIDVIPYLSATAFNRQIGARNKAGIQLRSWIMGVENFDDGVIQTLTKNNRKGWIRTPQKTDPHKWTMLPTFGRMAPKNNWEKQGFVYINSNEGEKAIKYYCGGF